MNSRRPIDHLHEVRRCQQVITLLNSYRIQMLRAAKVARNRGQTAGSNPDPSLGVRMPPSAECGHCHVRRPRPPRRGEQATGPKVPASSGETYEKPRPRAVGRCLVDRTPADWSGAPAEKRTRRGWTVPPKCLLRRHAAQTHIDRRKRVPHEARSRRPARSLRARATAERRRAPRLAPRPAAAAHRPRRPARLCAVPSRCCDDDPKFAFASCEHAAALALGSKEPEATFTNL
jgi:hypothetical protein